MRTLGGDGSSDFTSEEFWGATRRPLEQATGLPPVAYTGDDFFEVEQRRLFARAWVAVASASAVAEPGRLLVRSVGGTSVLIARDRDGVLRGFINSCRHRGTELASEDCTVSRMIRCPYHRWGYALDGSLVASPLFDEVPRADFDPAELSLLPVRVETWGLDVYVCLDEATPPLAEWLGDLPERMAGYGFEDWVVHQKCTFDVAANWKLITENFQEYYHLAWVHPELAKVSRVRDHYRYQGPGLYCGQTTTPVSSDERDDWLVLPNAPGLDASDSVSGRFVAVFPQPDAGGAARPRLRDPPRAFVVGGHPGALHSAAAVVPAGRAVRRRRGRDAQVLDRGQQRGHRHLRAVPPGACARRRPARAAVTALRGAAAPLPEHGGGLHDRRFARRRAEDPAR